MGGPLGCFEIPSPYDPNLRKWSAKWHVAGAVGAAVGGGRAVGGGGMAGGLRRATRGTIPKGPLGPVDHEGRGQTVETLQGFVVPADTGMGHRHETALGPSSSTKVFLSLHRPALG